MRSSATWRSGLVALAALAAACEPAGDHHAGFLQFGTVVTVSEFAMIVDAGGDASLTPGMHERVDWPDAGNHQ